MARYVPDVVPPELAGLLVVFEPCPVCTGMACWAERCSRCAGLRQVTRRDYPGRRVGVTYATVMAAAQVLRHRDGLAWECPRCFTRDEDGPAHAGHGIRYCAKCGVVVATQAPARPPGKGRNRLSSPRRREAREKLAERHGWRCHLCELAIDPRGTGFDAPTLDHLVPRSHGGSNAIANLALAHRGCNHLRGEMPLPISAAFRRELRGRVFARGKRKRRAASHRARVAAGGSVGPTELGGRDGGEGAGTSPTADGRASDDVGDVGRGDRVAAGAGIAAGG